MRRKFYWLLLLLLGLPNLAVATREKCGEPPPPQFKEESDKSIKGDLEGKANFLLSWVGKAGLGAKIESTRKEIFAKYSDANTANMDRYLGYMFCLLIFDPTNKLDHQHKIKALMEFYQQQREKPPPPPPLTERSREKPIDPGEMQLPPKRPEPWADQLIGSWKTDVLDNNIPATLVYTFNPDGSFISTEGNYGESRGRFEYRRGHVLIEWNSGTNEFAKLDIIGVMGNQFRYQIVDHTDQRQIGQEFIFQRLRR